MTNSLSLNKPKLSIKDQVLATLIANIAAIFLPQFFHLLGDVSGFGKNLGVFFSPMHFPIILIGLLAGPFVGGISGFVSPLISAALTGMPSGTSLPLMMIELAGYGVCAGLLRNVKIPGIIKVFITLVAGRFLRMLAVVAAVYIFGQNLPILGIWLSVPKTIIGIVFQLILIPLFVYWIENRQVAVLLFIFIFSSF